MCTSMEVAASRRLQQYDDGSVDAEDARGNAMTNRAADASAESGKAAARTMCPQ